MTTRIPKPDDEYEFQDMALDVAERWWKATVQRNGRRGQGQDGVDLYATRTDGTNIGGQCKNVKTLTIANIKKEITAAESFTPPLDEYWIITSLDSDARLQEAVRKLSSERRKRRAFHVELRFWEDIQSTLCATAPDQVDLLAKYYGEWVHRSRSAMTARAARSCPLVDWRNFQPVPEGSFPATTVYLKLVATPARWNNLKIDGDLFQEFRKQVQDHFGVVDPEAPPYAPRRDAVELLWRKPGLALHWMRGRDGSIGFTTTLESLFRPNHVSLMEVAIDCLRFLKFAISVLNGEALTLTLDFQPWKLIAVPGPLAPEYARKTELLGMPTTMTGPDPSTGTTFLEASELFSSSDLSQPFQKLADMLVNRWRPIYNLHGLSAKPLSAALATLAADVLKWRPATATTSSTTK